MFQRPSWTRAKINDKWARIIGIPAIAFFVILIGEDNLSVLSIRQISISFIRDLAYVFFYWESARLVFLYVHHRYPNLKDTRWRVILQALLFILLITFGSLLLAAINTTFFNDKSQESFFQEVRDIAAKSFLLLGLVMLVYECAQLFALYQKNLYEAEKFKKEAVLAQFELLKSQVDPHFLFNSLNSLISLIPEDPQKSVEFVQSLANVYRSVLTFNDEKLVELGLEYRFLKDYIFLFQIRFGKNLIIHYDIPENMDDYLIVPFTLQMLVENAIKHNVVSQLKPLTIAIRIENNHIQVVNNLQKKTSGVQSTFIGLHNIVNRFQLVSSRSVVIDANEHEFKVTIPLIKKEKS